MTDDWLTATPPGIALMPLDAIAEGMARNVVVQLNHGRFHGFIVRHGDSVVGYVDRCPHMGLPLARALDDYLSPARDLIVCGWHGAIFDIATGVCVGGPCRRERLRQWPVTIRDKTVFTG